MPPSQTTQPAQPTQTPTKTHPLPPYNHVSPTDDNLSKIVSVISAAFVSTPLMIAFYGELNDFTPTTPHSAITRAACIAYYTAGITRIGTNGGVLVESGAYQAIAVWEPPSYAAADFTSGRARWGPLSREWTAKVKAARIRHLGVATEGANPPLDQVDEFTPTQLRQFWHLGFLARDPDLPKVPGAVSAVMLPFLERAEVEGLPAWLEATSLSGVAMYTAYGFRLVETITVGKGAVGADGWLKEGGEGASGYCMIYDGHL